MRSLLLHFFRPIAIQPLGAMLRSLFAALILSGVAVGGLGSLAEASERCAGQRATETQSRIVGGVNASIDNWPAMGVLRQKLPERALHVYFYGGSAIASNWILTAAHCFVEIQQNADGSFSNGNGEQIGLMAILGTDDLDDVDVDRPRTIEQVIIHENYNGRAIRGNDIALVRIQDALPGALMRLSPDEESDPENPPGARVFVVGFGYLRMEAGRSFADIQTAVPIGSHRKTP